MKKVIAIDGPSGAGKTTVAKLVANSLGFNYLDTGALYRAIALSLREKGIDEKDNDEKIKHAIKDVEVRYINGKVFLNKRDVSDMIRTKEIDHYSSVFSARKIIRDFLLNSQRNAALFDNLVVEGRDTTTVVFPEAYKKIFLDASVDERARRRFLQFKEKGIDITIEDARNSIIERDKRDESRDLAPLSVAPDALLIDSSFLSIEDVVKIILDYVRN
ncbi:MAG: (d)CMP kinase [Nitrospirae bacterium]|nr:(d)CMP kinase [Nitrospirota bacterium]